MSELTQKGFIYFAESGDLIKVGFSKDPLERLKALYSPNGEEIRLIGVMPNKTRYVEASFHHILAADRVQGEWFRRSKELMSFIKENTVPATEVGAYSRSGKIIMNFKAPASVRQKLKEMAIKHKTTSQALMTEALNLMLVKHGLEPIA